MVGVIPRLSLEEGIAELARARAGVEPLVCAVVKADRFVAQEVIVDELAQSRQRADAGSHGRVGRVALGLFDGNGA